ncbi:uncharacterized protein LOC135375307 isoform X3 [Ornithodoros turicata]|uniref:uncharacterized protein LOC135375307 isoform X3 n=1 Tax=Ornithodoros turicata TaxID=34597 RepID=UPI00313A1D7D
MEVAVSSFLTTMSRAWVRALLTDELRVCAARRTFMIWRPNSIWDLGQLQPSTDTTQAWFHCMFPVVAALLWGQGTKHLEKCPQVVVFWDLGFPADTPEMVVGTVAAHRNWNALFRSGL